MRMKLKHAENGFTLAEAVIVIVITGIIAAVVGVFITRPVEAYFAAARRAELTDTADSAVRRMARDIQAALPNSVRIDPTGRMLEFVPIVGAGRYRASTGAGGAGNPLAFDNAADNSFDVLGPTVNIANGDSIVIYNLGQPAIVGPPSSPGSDVYEGTSRRAAAVFANNLQIVTFTAQATPFPFESPGSRFHIVNGAVSYVCQPNAGSPSNGVLLRYAGYPIQAAQPTLAQLNAATTGRMVAANVANCNMTYAPGPEVSLGLVSIFLQLADNGAPTETVQLLHQINIDNTP